MKVYKEERSTFTYSSTVREWWSDFTPPGLELLVHIWQGTGLSVLRRWHREKCLALPQPCEQSQQHFPLCLSTVPRRHKESGGKAPSILSSGHCHALTPESIVFLIIGHITDWVPTSTAVRMRRPYSDHAARACPHSSTSLTVLICPSSKQRKHGRYEFDGYAVQFTHRIEVSGSMSWVSSLRKKTFFSLCCVSSLPGHLLCTLRYLLIPVATGRAVGLHRGTQDCTSRNRFSQRRCRR